MKKLLTISSLIITGAAGAQDLSGINPEHIDRTYPAIQENKIQVKSIPLSTGVELEYAEQGIAGSTTIIFLHGITDSWHSFETVLSYLPDDLHAIAISQRGHGNSARPSEGYSTRDFADDVAAFIKQKNLGPVVIAGHSMGGVNAQQFALSYPSLTRGLIIIDSDPAFVNNPGMTEFLDEVMNMKGTIPRDYMDGFQKATLANPIDSSYYELIVNEGLKCPVYVFQAALKGLMEVNFTQSLKNLEMHVAIFWGDKDAFCLKAGQDILLSNIKNVTSYVYENTGHALHWEQPARFAKDLSAFIKTNIK
ncbi:MAG TPA: alpha/beta hydrolase [Chitinophagaceae bacterium]